MNTYSYADGFLLSGKVRFAVITVEFELNLYCLFLNLFIDWCVGAEEASDDKPQNEVGGRKTIDPFVQNTIFGRKKTKWDVMGWAG